MAEMTEAEYWQAKTAIAHLAADERMYRDTGQWDAMHAAYHDGAHVRVYWFNGVAEDFIAASQFMTEPGQKWSSALHLNGPTSVVLDGDRAIADTGCTVNRRTSHEGFEYDSVTFVRHRSMVERDADGVWKLRSFRAIYERDCIVPVVPGDSIPIDKERLATYRQSYKFLCYFAEEMGMPPNLTLPGMDRPDLVDAMIADEEEWLAGGTYTPVLS